MSEFILPSIGEGIETVSISEIYIKTDSTIEVDEVLLLVESDKASMEIPSDFKGTVTKINVKIGDLISPGTSILEYDDSNNIQDDKKTTEKPNIVTEENNIEDSANDKEITKEATSINIDNNFSNDRLISHAAPSIKKLARELGCDISNIKGTGTNNRITKEDVYNYINSTLTKDDSSNNSKSYSNIEDSSEFINQFSKWGKLEVISLGKIQKMTATRLTEAWQNIPHVTQFEEVDITDLDKIVKLLKKVNTDKKTKVSYIPFFIKTVSKILKKLIKFNSSLTPNHKEIIIKNYYNIGIAVDTNKGLVVPVIKNVNKKSIKQITIELNVLIDKARDGKLNIDDMSGGCFTISSLGNIGGRFFTPIINPPEVAILGISAFKIKPILIDGKFKPRKMLPISLSYDHRVINGSDAAKFTNQFSTIISDPAKLSK